MSFVKFGTTANQQVTVSTTAINLATQFADDGNIENLKKADVCIVRVNNGQPIRYLVDGGTPTATHGMVTSSGFSVTGSTPDKITLIKDTNASGDAEVLVTLGFTTVGTTQIVNL